MVIGMNYATWKITDELFTRPLVSRLAVIMSFGFLPLVFNIMFAYGLMYGLFFSSFAILFFLRYLDVVRLGMRFFRWSYYLWPTG